MVPPSLCRQAGIPAGAGRDFLYLPESIRQVSGTEHPWTEPHHACRDELSECAGTAIDFIDIEILQSQLAENIANETKISIIQGNRRGKKQFFRGGKTETAEIA